MKGGTNKSRLGYVQEKLLTILETNKKINNIGQNYMKHSNRSTTVPDVMLWSFYEEVKKKYPNAKLIKKTNMYKATITIE